MVELYEDSHVISLVDSALPSCYKLLNLELPKSNFCVLNFQLENVLS